MTIDLLTTRLKKLNQVVSDNKANVVKLLSKIQNFASDLPKQAKNLEAIADRALKGAKVDKEQVKQLNEDIDRLNANIATLTSTIVALGIADAACITLGVVAVVVAVSRCSNGRSHYLHCAG